MWARHVYTQNSETEENMKGATQQSLIESSLCHVIKMNLIPEVINKALKIAFPPFLFLLACLQLYSLK